MHILDETSLVIALAALLGVVAGCGGTVERGQVDSGLPEDRRLNELTREEADQVCDAEIVASNELVLDLDICLSQAWSAVAFAAFETGMEEAQMRQLCTESYDLCVETTEPEDYLAGECMGAETPPESCEATVGQLEACWTDELHQMAEPRPSDCDSITRAEGDAYVLSTAMSREVTPACETFYEVCPTGFPR